MTLIPGLTGLSRAVNPWYVLPAACGAALQCATRSHFSLADSWWNTKPFVRFTHFTSLHYYYCTTGSGEQHRYDITQTERNGQEECYSELRWEHTERSKEETATLLWAWYHLVQFQHSDHQEATSEWHRHQLDAASGNSGSNQQPRPRGKLNKTLLSVQPNDILLLLQGVGRVSFETSAN